jgi:hypothetical protein
MARLRPLPQPQLNTAPAAKVTNRPRSPHLFKKGDPKPANAGRARGQPNRVSTSTREAILLGLEIAGNRMGTQGVVSYVVQAALADFRNGIQLLSLVTPKPLDVVVRHEEQVLLTVEDLDRSLVEAGLPPTKEIFALDYRDTAEIPDEAVAPEAAKEGEQS